MYDAPMACWQRRHRLPYLKKSRLRNRGARMASVPRVQMYTALGVTWVTRRLMRSGRRRYSGSISIVAVIPCAVEGDISHRAANMGGASLQTLGRIWLLVI